MLSGTDEANNRIWGLSCSCSHYGVPATLETNLSVYNTVCLNFNVNIPAGG